ncbi:MAG: pilus assembly protein [Rhodobacteraceae bacterium]|nr:pilus assembly protein [Paracoccaceae bacterium]
MNLLAGIKARARAFHNDTDASVSVEFLLAMPMVFWAFMASYVFFDGYKQSSVNLKAAYTIGDLISRETDPITDDYLDSMYALHRLLTRATSSTTLRITVVRWNEDTNRFYRDWSQTRGTIEPLTSADVLLLTDKLPLMPNAERVIIVETTNSFTPFYNIGMDTLSLDNFVFTRPRFAPQVIWES